MIADEPSAQEAVPRVTRASVKKVPVTRSLKRSKYPRKQMLLLKLMDLLLLLMMLVNTLDLLSLYSLYVYSCLFFQALMKKFIALGTECAEYLKVARASEGKFYCLVFSCLL
jgi:hypothetical protein